MSSVDHLLERMRASKAGWRDTDLRKLYLGLGFQLKEGGKHCVYIHPKYPELRATVTRSRFLAKGYITHALNLAERLRELEANDDRDNE